MPFRTSAFLSGISAGLTVLRIHLSSAITMVEEDSSTASRSMSGTGFGSWRGPSALYRPPTALVAASISDSFSREVTLCTCGRRCEQARKIFSSCRLWSGSGGASARVAFASPSGMNG